MCVSVCVETGTFWSTFRTGCVTAEKLRCWTSRTTSCLSFRPGYLPYSVTNPEPLLLKCYVLCYIIWMYSTWCNNQMAILSRIRRSGVTLHMVMLFNCSLYLPHWFSLCPSKEFFMVLEPWKEQSTNSSWYQSVSTVSSSCNCKIWPSYSAWLRVTFIHCQSSTQTFAFEWDIRKAFANEIIFLPPPYPLRTSVMVSGENKKLLCSSV